MSKVATYYKALNDYTGKTSYDVTYRALKKRGEIRWHKAAGYVIRRKDGSPMTCYGLILGIDAQKKASDMIESALNQAKLANEAKTLFLARISHDIRTPLNGIQGLIEINEKHADDIELTTKNREKAKVAADHLLSLINDVLQLSKLEDSEIELSRDPFNLLELLDNIFTIIELKANENGITVSRTDDLSMSQYPYLWESPLYVRQIFINILSSAIKYNKKNGSIDLRAYAKKIDKNTILFQGIITDTGIGMDEEFLKNIFNPFTRENEEITSQYEGTGLGMAIVKRLVDKMGGTIQVESKVGIGSRFIVEIPFEIAQKEEIDKIQEEYQSRAITKKHILLVEDNELNMDIAETLLTDAGMNTHLAKPLDVQKMLYVIAKNINK